MSTGTVELLTWLADDTAPKPTPKTLLRLHQLGVTDLVAVGDLHGDSREFAREIAALVDAGWSGNPTVAVRYAATVGARTIVEDPDNLGAWEAVATAFGRHTMSDRDLRLTWSRWTSSEGRQHHARSSVELVTGFLDAGRGPTYAQQMLAHAAAARIAPDEFGYGTSVRPETLTDLAGAGITSRFDLDPLLAAGLELAEVIAATSRGIAPGALLAALADGLPRTGWDRLVGLPATWFPTEIDSRPADPVADGMIGQGYTWDSMQTLSSRGWDRFSTYTARYGVSYARGVSVKMSPPTALELSAIMPLADVGRWAKELTTGKSGGRWSDPALPPLLDWLDAARLLGSVPPLVEAGVRSSHLGTYRAAGCRSVDDVVTATRAGITPARAKLLLGRHGEKLHTWSPQRIRSLNALLDAHVS